MNLACIKNVITMNSTDKMQQGGMVTPGFRFYPIEEELMSFYLWHKLEGTRSDIDQVIREVDIYAIEPWDLPGYCGEFCKGDTEQWFFFTARQEREARGGRPNRTTGSGYWKATGSQTYVFSSDNRVIGLKKTMVFYSGKAPTGTKTKWKMNEYRAILAATTTSTPQPQLRKEFSLCRVYIVSGSSRAFDRRPLNHTIAAASIATETPDLYMPNVTVAASTSNTFNNKDDENDNITIYHSDDWDLMMGEGLEPLFAEWEPHQWHAKQSLNF